MTQIQGCLPVVEQTLAELTRARHRTLHPSAPEHWHSSAPGAGEEITALSSSRTMAEMCGNGGNHTELQLQQQQLRRQQFTLNP
jgi:hypothetical protein